jgi:hypothetical protein
MKYYGVHFFIFNEDSMNKILKIIILLAAMVFQHPAQALPDAKTSIAVTAAVVAAVGALGLVTIGITAGVIGKEPYCEEESQYPTLVQNLTTYVPCPDCYSSPNPQQCYNATSCYDDKPKCIDSNGNSVDAFTRNGPVYDGIYASIGAMGLGLILGIVACNL